ncbi:hypothetical protein [uncultured Azonexus sp.]|uniref:hypothetical protein n=1 Tax=uncultured Azonexus sp. TaxID=520307 RepID=UPI0026164C66|nr:hypothetical protein [uncultured Azonexus sp.]
MHLFTDISAHGLGHLAISAPVLNALAILAPGLRITVRSRLPTSKLRERIAAPFELIEAASDFGFIMHDALAVDREASTHAYRAAHAEWSQRVAEETEFLRTLAPDAVLSNVAYLPLAGAKRAGIPALAICPLNWADLFEHFFAGEPWSAAIHAQILAAYRDADVFLRPMPGMPMPKLDKGEAIAPIAACGTRHELGLGEGRNILIALGGFAHRLPVERWPRFPGTRWLVPADWQCRHPDAIAFEHLGLSFTDLLTSVDAVITKPGYGTFAEAACNGTPVLYLRRDNWPEQDYLIDWLQTHGRCRELPAERLHAGEFDEELTRLLNTPTPPLPLPQGAIQAARRILDWLDPALRNASRTP